MISKTETTETLLRRLEQAERRLKMIGSLLFVCLLSGLFLATRTPAHSQGGDLNSRVAALEAKLAFLTTNGTEMTISGANLHIINGMGKTGTKNGTGNLIIGYAELRNDGTDDRTGSHNLMMGKLNNYSS